MFRLIFFLFGIVCGFVAAIFVLPIPGKTFFNKMSKLPNSAKDLIDDGLDLAVSLSKILLGVYQELKIRLAEALEVAHDRTESMRRELESKSIVEELVEDSSGHKKTMQKVMDKIGDKMLSHREEAKSV